MATERLEMSEIKRLYPGEWVLIGNPVLNETGIQVLSGIPILHSKDKKEVAYFGRAKVVNYQTYKLVYTGSRKPVRRIITLYSHPLT